MIPVIREAPLIGELLEIPHDRLLLYENAEKPLLPSFNRLILQEVCVASCVGAVDTPSALAYAASIRGERCRPGSVAATALTINITGESYRGVKARKLASKKRRVFERPKRYRQRREDTGQQIKWPETKVPQRKFRGSACRVRWTFQMQHSRSPYNSICRGNRFARRQILPIAGGMERLIGACRVATIRKSPGEESEKAAGPSAFRPPTVPRSVS